MYSDFSYTVGQHNYQTNIQILSTELVKQSKESRNEYFLTLSTKEPMPMPDWIGGKKKLPWSANSPHAMLT